MASATVSAERKMPGPISHWPRPRSDPTSRPSASTTSAVAATPAQVRCHQPAKTPNLASPPTSRTAPKVTRPTTLRDRGADGAEWVPRRRGRFGRCRLLGRAGRGVLTEVHLARVHLARTGPAVGRVLVPERGLLERRRRRGIGARIAAGGDGAGPG